MANENEVSGQITGNVLFYSKPEPLAVELHKGLGVKRMDGPFGFAKAGHAVPLTVTEFSLAALTGPIIFVGEDKTPLAVMGLNPNENLFLREDGLFEAGVYIPAYIRRYPFVFANDPNAQQSILCIDRAAEFIVEGGDMAFFNEDGTATEYTQGCIEFCNNYEVERQSIAEFCGISEAKLNALTQPKLAELRDNGALMQIYAHLISLVGWDRLIALQMYKVATAAANAA